MLTIKAFSSLVKPVVLPFLGKPVDFSSAVKPVGSSVVKMLGSPLPVLAVMIYRESST